MCRRIKILLTLGLLLPMISYADEQIELERITVICQGEVDRNFCQAVAQRSEQLLPMAETLIGHQIESVSIAVGDVSDFFNGTATVLPQNKIQIYSNYPRQGSLLSMQDSLNSVIFHELIHVVHLSQSSGIAKGLETVLGRHFFTLPNGLIPRWLSEGVAVWAESSVSDGRAVAADYRGKLRMASIAGLPSLPDFTVSAGVPVVGDQYLIGSAFMRFISDKYGPNAVSLWVQSMGRMPISGYYDTAYRRAFGRHILADWTDFGQWLSEQTELELAAIRQAPVVMGTELATGRVGAPIIGPNNSVWHVQGRIEAPSVLKKVNSNEEIQLPNGIVDIQYRQGQWQALKSRRCSSQNSVKNSSENGTRSSTELIEYRAGKWRSVSTCQGVVEFVPGSDALMIQFDGLSYQLTDGTQQIITPGRLLSASAAQNRLVVLVEENQQRALYERKGDQWIALNVADLNPEAVSISGTEVYFISSKSGVRNVWRLSDKQPVTNVEGGVNAMTAIDNALFIRHLVPQWFQISQLSLPLQSVAAPQLPPAANTAANLDIVNLDMDLDKQASTIQTDSPPALSPTLTSYYAPLALRPYNWLPAFSAGDEGLSLGATVNFTDKTSTHAFSLSGVAGNDGEQLSATYSWPSFQLSARLGQTRSGPSSNTDWQVSASHAKTIDLGLRGTLSYQPIVSTGDRDSRLGLGLSYGQHHHVTYGVLPRQGLRLTTMNSVDGDWQWRNQSSLTLQRQLSPVYLHAALNVIAGQDLDIIDSIMVSNVGASPTQTSISHPGALAVNNADFVWQQQTKMYWGSAYQPKGWGLSPAGYNRWGLTATTLVSGSEDSLIASAGFGGFIDLSIGFGLVAPVRTEVGLLLGIEQAEWSLVAGIELPTF